MQLARLAVAAQAAADATVLDSTRHEVITELLAALLPTRRHRQCQRVKKPSKNTFEVRKRDQPRTRSNAHYTLRVTKHPT
ncbi:hypothetical protein ACFW2Y_14255 [Streptomyces sp. NPDC058877]|uniref:hypothetical protein n=1 Tax=unclassified Streptomyces TaxID=2593676 RepID=UPI003699684A